MHFTCEVEECFRRTKSRHHKRCRACPPALLGKELNLTTCEVPSCTNAPISSYAKLCSKHHSRKYKYNLTAEEMDKLDLGHTCPICRERSATDVDHCHKEGHVRGYLCRKCNLIVGMVESDQFSWVLSYLHDDLGDPGSTWRRQLES